MTYRAFQLVPKQVAPLLRQVERVGAYVRDRYGEPAELRLGPLDEAVRASLLAYFPDVPVVDDPRSGMTGNYWFGYREG